MRSTSLLLLSFLAAGLLCAVDAQRTSAAPNTDDPLAALSTRSEAEVQKLSAEATAQYKVASDAITGIVTKIKNNEIKKIHPKEFGAAYVAAQRMKRLGKQLEQWGETAGIDFQVRASGVLTDWDLARKDFLKLPEISSKLPALAKAFQGEATKRKKSVTAAGQLYKQQKFDEAEQILCENIDALEQVGSLLDDTLKEPIVPFTQALNTVMIDLNKLRVQAGQERLQGLIDADSPGFEPLLAQMKQAVADLKAGQKPKFDGQEMTSPEFVKAAGDAWKKSQLSAIHCEAYYTAMGMKRGGENSEPLNKLIGEQETFSTKFLADLGEVIAADAANIDAAQAEEVYLAYLQELAPLATLATPGTVAKAVEPQLKSLIARSAELQANVGAYEAATADLLRWRKLVADEQQKGAAAAFPAMEPTFTVVVRMPSAASVGLLRDQSESMNQLAILSPMPLTLERMKTDLIGKQVQLPACTGINPAKKLVASQYDNRHYATFTLPAGFAAEQAALRDDLLVSESLPALTLAAAMAVAASDRGDLQAAGVTLNKIHVEPFATRMATLPAAASAIFPLGALPREGMDDPPLYQILFRSDVQPGWVRNEYFFVNK